MGVGWVGVGGLGGDGEYGVARGVSDEPCPPPARLPRPRCTVKGGCVWRVCEVLRGRAARLLTEPQRQGERTRGQGGRGGGGGGGGGGDGGGEGGGRGGGAGARMMPKPAHRVRGGDRELLS